MWNQWGALAAAASAPMPPMPSAAVPQATTAPPLPDAPPPPMSAPAGVAAASVQPVSAPIIGPTVPAAAALAAQAGVMPGSIGAAMGDHSSPYGQYTAAQYAAMTPEQQYALQQHWQQWQAYQQEYAKWHAQYGEQYKREMAAAGASVYGSYYQQPPPPPPDTGSNMAQQPQPPQSQTQHTPQLHAHKPPQPQPPPPAQLQPQSQPSSHHTLDIPGKISGQPHMYNQPPPPQQQMMLHAAPMQNNVPRPPPGLQQQWQQQSQFNNAPGHVNSPLVNLKQPPPNFSQGPPPQMNQQPPFQQHQRPALLHQQQQQQHPSQNQSHPYMQRQQPPPMNQMPSNTFGYNNPNQVNNTPNVNNLMAPDPTDAPIHHQQGNERGRNRSLDFNPRSSNPNENVCTPEVGTPEKKPNQWNSNAGDVLEGNSQTENPDNQSDEDTWCGDDNSRDFSNQWNPNSQNSYQNNRRTNQRRNQKDNLGGFGFGSSQRPDRNQSSKEQNQEESGNMPWNNSRNIGQGNDFGPWSNNGGNTNRNSDHFGNQRNQSSPWVNRDMAEQSGRWNNNQNNAGFGRDNSNRWSNNDDNFAQNRSVGPNDQKFGTNKPDGQNRWTNQQDNQGPKSFATNQNLNQNWPNQDPSNYGSNSFQRRIWGSGGNANQNTMNQASMHQSNMNQGNMGQGNINRNQPQRRELDEESFDRQFRQWEQQFEDWKRANVNNPDREMYTRYEQEFEKQRTRIMERRDQMRRRKMEQMQSQQTALNNNHFQGVNSISETEKHMEPEPSTAAGQKLLADGNNFNECAQHAEEATPQSSSKANLQHDPARRERENSVLSNAPQNETENGNENDDIIISSNSPRSAERVGLGKRKSRFNAPHVDSKISKAEPATEIINLDDEEDDEEVEEEEKEEDEEQPAPAIAEIFKKSSGIPGLDLVEDNSDGKNERNMEKDDGVIEKGRGNDRSLCCDRSRSAERSSASSGSVSPSKASKKIPSLFDVVVEKPPISPDHQPESNESDGDGNSKNSLAAQVEAAGFTILDITKALKDPEFMQKIGQALAKASGSTTTVDVSTAPAENLLKQMPLVLQQLQEQKAQVDQHVDGRQLSFAEWQRKKGEQFGGPDNTVNKLSVKPDDNRGPTGVDVENESNSTGCATNFEGMSPQFLGNRPSFGGSDHSFGPYDSGIGNRPNMAGPNFGPNGPNFGGNAPMFGGDGPNFGGPNGPNFGPNFGGRGNNFGGNDPNFGPPNFGGNGPNGPNFGANRPNFNLNGPNFSFDGPNNGNNRNFGGNFRGNGPNNPNFGRNNRNFGGNNQNFDGSNHNFGGNNSNFGPNDADDPKNRNSNNPFRRSGSGGPMSNFNENNPNAKIQFGRRGNDRQHGPDDNNINNESKMWIHGSANRNKRDDFYRPMQVFDYQNTMLRPKVFDYGHMPTAGAMGATGTMGATAAVGVAGPRALEPQEEFKPFKTIDYGHGSSSNTDNANAFQTELPHKRNQNQNQYQNQNQLQNQNKNQIQNQTQIGRMANYNQNHEGLNKPHDQEPKEQHESGDVESAYESQVTMPPGGQENKYEESKNSENTDANIVDKDDLEEISDCDDFLPPPPPPMFSRYTGAYRPSLYPPRADPKAKAISIFPSTASANDNIQRASSKRLEMSIPTAENQNTITIDEILLHPGRQSRPKKICLIFRGPPGSGKSYAAKLIKEKETEMGGGNARILSIDDYFLIENDYEEKCPKTGKKIPKKEILYEYDADMEETYMQYLIKSFKRTVSDNLYDFIIVDCNNNSLRSLNEFYCHAKDSGFVPYIIDLISDWEACFNRNIHERSAEDIKAIVDEWKPTPLHYIKLDISSLLENVVEMEDAENMVMDNDAGDDSQGNSGTDLAAGGQTELVSELNEDDEEDSNEAIDPTTSCGFLKSKWENETSFENLARLDGTNKPMTKRKATMEDYLQIDDWEPPQAGGANGKKRVRWADIEEKRAQEKMRAIGFVVGQTDWKRMMDPNAGNRALNKTKFIERVTRRR